MALHAPTVAEGFLFTESPRWHDGSLWFVDMHDRRVVRLSAGGVETVAVIDGDEPSGLGWLPDGRLLVVSMERQQLLRQEPDGALVVHADLSALSRGTLNDMIVAADGAAYVGDMGYRLHGSVDPNNGQTLLVSPSGEVTVAADHLRAPNGHVLTPDERTLIVGESAGGCLTAFDRADDGTLSNRRTFAVLTPSDPAVGFAPPDGICLDAHGAVWVADPYGKRVLRVVDGGAVTDVIGFGDEMPVACVLGGEGRRTLYICAGESWRPEDLRGRRTARVAALAVDVPGAGKP